MRVKEKAILSFYAVVLSAVWLRRQWSGVTRWAWARCDKVDKWSGVTRWAWRHLTCGRLSIEAAVRSEAVFLSGNSRVGWLCNF